jgi:hypothetical protein
MRKTIFLAIILTAFTTGRLLAQPAPSSAEALTTPAPVPSFSDRVAQFKARAEGEQAKATPLSRFSLDFPGGTPKQLAAAIEKAMDKPLNVIVPDEFAGTKLPPIKVTDVTVPQLFDTLQIGSRRYFGNEVQSSYGFTSNENSKSDNTIWTFSVFTNQVSGQLTKFNIDFPGGKPKDLVAAIQKASGHPLNAIVPEEFADMKLPPLKMNGVDVNQLFHALALASFKTETYETGMFGNPYQTKNTSYAFQTEGKITDDSIWYFHVDKVPTPPITPPQKTSRFYALAPYLDRGLKVDDITTAIETAWKMMGETSPPAISFHKDTKLLIAVGAPDKLQTIDAVLQALKPEMTKPQATPTPPPDKKTAVSKPSE